MKALGDLITSFTHSYQDKSQVLQCYDFITGEPILVPIPIGVTPSDHAKNMYLKAKVSVSVSVCVFERVCMNECVYERVCMRECV